MSFGHSLKFGGGLIQLQIEILLEEHLKEKCFAISTIWQSEVIQKP